MLKVGGDFGAAHPLMRIMLASTKEISSFVFIYFVPPVMFIYITSFRAKSYLLSTLELIVAQRPPTFFCQTPYLDSGARLIVIGLHTYKAQKVNSHKIA